MTTLALGLVITCLVTGGWLVACEWLERRREKLSEGYFDQPRHVTVIKTPVDWEERDWL